ncbi:GH25 family lysozyme [Ligilactobacillus salivarius]|uniref:GH25 family lysozyme n=1 Tax=Ligilactobacillus salivarius TaxID=1624 RepID=UPI002023648F|nr:GH25 family lysozyme [Ligilactobacillus salivarius]URI13478.1 SH3 domain-containing protein [Ligilactobacillus salivarius]UUB35316.1 SH3 domain-containing protein [Ligilactobacillus salivarius]
MVNLVADVASFQPEDLGFFKALASQGVKAVIVKLTEGSADGTAYINPKAQNQIINARKAGLLVNAYHFARYISIQDAKNEADFFVTVAKRMGIGTDSVMAVDLEASEITPNLNAKTNAFLQYVKDCGYPNVDYYSMASWFWNGTLNPDVILAKNKWVANYGVSQPGVNNVGTWQFSSSWTVNGSKVDMSYDFSGFYTERHITANSESVVNTPKPKPQAVTYDSWTDNLGDVWYKEDGTFTLSESINLRWGAKTDSDLIVTLNPGDVVKYDAFSKHDGYVWLRQVRDNGQFGYLASGECDNSGKRTSSWGKFE